MLPLNYLLYMAEADGYTAIAQTRQARINAATKLFVSLVHEGYDINTPDIQNTVLTKYNLHDLTMGETKQIASKVHAEINSLYF